MTQLEQIKLRTAGLGNHFQKYYLTIERHHEALRDALESSERNLQVDLWATSPDPQEDMEVVAGLSDDVAESVRLLSCYYAIQFLRMNFRHLDILSLGIASGDTLKEAYYTFMKHIGQDFRDLTRAYMEALLGLYLPRSDWPEFFICSVGTRADQDDIDVGIITAGSPGDADLDTAFQRITQHMLVHATPLHLHLSEHVGEHVYTSTMSEFAHLLDREIGDIVILSELINGSRIFGSEELFGRFQQQIMSRYYYRPDNDPRFHEGFLRGIMGEARALLVSPLQADAISPKDDAIRSLKFLLYAKKSAHDLEEVNAWDIIQALIRREPHLITEYEFLFRATSFLEMFRFQMQMFVAQEETFRPADIDPEQLQVVAGRMGYQPVGTVNAWEQLIIDYYRNVKEVRSLCEYLLGDLRKHLASVSVFSPLSEAEVPLRGPDAADEPFALRFIRTTRFFRATRYWDDVLDRFSTDPRLLDAFIKSWEDLDETIRPDVIEEYVGWAEHTPITLIRFLTILLHRQENEIGPTLARTMNACFLVYLEQLPYNLERLCRIFSHYPKIIHEYLRYLTEEESVLLHRILSQRVIDDRLAEARGKLVDLCTVHKVSGQYFYRFFSRVVANHPEYLAALSDDERQRAISGGLLAMVDAYPLSAQKKQILGDYYDLEFLRVGIGTLHGADLASTYRAFTEFCDNYVGKLFRVCAEEVEEEEADGLARLDSSLAVLAAGGHARQQAYDDDYDLIALIDTEDEEALRLSNRIIGRMNSEIIKRGVLPHHRLADIFGGYVVPISALETYLSSEDDEVFIDLSQLLESRVVVGSVEMRQAINERVLRRHVFERKATYVRRMMAEILERREDLPSDREGACNLKETRGGLREIEALVLILKAWLEYESPISPTFFSEVQELAPAIREDLQILEVSLTLLRTVRDLYRITVAAEDTVETDHLWRITDVLQRTAPEIWPADRQVMDRLQETLARSAAAGDRVMDWVQTQL